MLIFLVGSLAFTSCSLVKREAYFIPHTVPVQLADDLTGVRVLVKDENGNLIEVYADIDKGVWLFSDPADFPPEKRAKAMNLRRKK